MNKIKAKARTKKLLKLRQISILNRVMQDNFPYIKIKDIEIDFLHLPQELSQEFDKTYLAERKEKANEL